MKYWIPKLIIIMIVTCLLGISYGYWTEQLYIEGDATFTAEVTIVETVKRPIQVKKTKDLIDKNNVIEEIEIEEQEVPTSDGVLDSVPDEKEVVEEVEIEVVKETVIEIEPKDMKDVVQE